MEFSMAHGYKRNEESESDVILLEETNSIQSDLIFLYEKGLYTDLEFRILVGESWKTMRAHKLVVATRSSVLSKEIYIYKGNCTITIKGIRERGVQEMLRYIYYDNVIFHTVSDLIETRKVARMYCMLHLEELCAVRLSELPINGETACEILETAIEMNLDNVQKQSLDFIAEQTEAVLDSASFKASNIETVIKIFQLKKLAVDSEVRLLHAAILWYLNQRNCCKREDLLSCINIMCLTVDEFLNIVISFPTFFSNSEISNILANMKKTESRELPSYCKVDIKCRFLINSREILKTQNSYCQSLPIYVNDACIQSSPLTLKDASSQYSNVVLKDACSETLSVTVKDACNQSIDIEVEHAYSQYEPAPVKDAFSQYISITIKDASTQSSPVPMKDSKCGTALIVSKHAYCQSLNVLLNDASVNTDIAPNETHLVMNTFSESSEISAKNEEGKNMTPLVPGKMKSKVDISFGVQDEYRLTNADVQFRITDENGYRYLYENSIMLTPKSPVFENLVNSSENKEITLDGDFSYEGVYYMLRYVREREVITICPASVAETYKLAQYFGMTELMDLCIAYFANPEAIIQENVFDILEFSSAVEYSVSQNILSIMLGHTKDVLKCPRFVNASPAVVFHLLRQETLALNCEAELLEGLVTWLQARRNSEFRHRALQYIAFESINLEDILNLDKKFPHFFSRDEVFNISAHKSTVSDLMLLTLNPPLLPSWYNRTRRSSPCLNGTSLGNMDSSNFLSIVLVSARPVVIHQLSTCHPLVRHSTRISIYQNAKPITYLVMLQVPFNMEAIKNVSINICKTCELNKLQKKSQIKFSFCNTPYANYLILHPPVEIFQNVATVLEVQFSPHQTSNNFVLVEPSFPADFSFENHKITIGNPEIFYKYDDTNTPFIISAFFFNKCPCFSFNLFRS